MPSTYEKELIDFLALEENIKYALEVAAHIEDVKFKIIKDFFEEIQTNFKQNLKGDSDYKSWEPKLRNIEKRTKYPGLTVSHLSYPRSLCYAIERGDGYLYHGISFWDIRKHKSKIQILPKVLNLMGILKKNKFKSSDSKSWLSEEYLPGFGSDEDFYFEAVNGKIKLAQEVVDRSWEVFEKVHKLIIEANEEITRKIKLPK